MAEWTRRELVKLGLAASAGVASGAHAQTQASAAGTASASVGAEGGRSVRERLCLDKGWRFALGHASDPEKDFGFGKMAGSGTFAKSGDAGGPTVLRKGEALDDPKWKAVNLPHDWAVDLPFVLEHTLVSHGGKPLGREYPETSVGWYRRQFHVPAEDLGKRLTIELDGVYRDAMVFVNGHFLGRNFSGYAPCAFDVTDFVDYGKENLLVVRVDATLNEGWFYEGAGMYRHVWLTKCAPVHFVRWGNFVQASLPQGVGGAAVVEVSSEVMNESSEPAMGRVRAKVVDPQGRVVGTMQSDEVHVEPGATATARMKMQWSEPMLWDLEHPNLYRFEAQLEAGGKVSDDDRVTFGVRSIRFDKDKGFLLNGRAVKVKGTCNHQDHAGLGTALPDSMQAYRVALLKQMGANAYRTSHNCPAAELLDACDRLGMLVMDETRQFSSSSEGLRELETMVRRDRNHPSVVLWSIANEERQQGSERGGRIGRTMKQAVRRLDPTRPVTAAMNGAWGKGLSDVVDVMGFNYKTVDIDAYRAAHPEQPLIGSEVASTVSTRGEYANNAEKGFVSAYDTEKPHWGATAEEWWTFFDERPWLAGGFVWTGFDYRGEPTPYHLPCVSSHFGLLDSCGFPKDNSFYYRAWWSGEPVLHVFPHWNWAGREGQEIEVWCYCNQESVELRLNGRSLGSQKVVKNGHLVWRVKYEPGVLEARALRQGRVVLTSRRETAGAPAKVVLEAQMAKLKADGEDTAVVHARIVDAQGRTVPMAENLVRFELSGPGVLLGVGNGNPSSYEADHASERKAFHGLCMCIVQAGTAAGELRVRATSEGLGAGECAIPLSAAVVRASA